MNSDEAAVAITARVTALLAIIARMPELFISQDDQVEALHLLGAPW